MGDMTDRNVEAVRAKLAERAATGLRKYGTTTERKDLTPLQWFQHLQDELMDASVYAEVLMRTFAVEPSPPTPPDHGPKLIRDGDGDTDVYWFTRRVNGVQEFFYTGCKWVAADHDEPDGEADGWLDKADALRALAKATGWEIRVVGTSRGFYDVVSGNWTLSSGGVWKEERPQGWVSKYLPEALARDCEARGHYPEAMCDRGEVGNA